MKLSRLVILSFDHHYLVRGELVREMRLGDAAAVQGSGWMLVFLMIFWRGGKGGTDSGIMVRGKGGSMVRGHEL